MKKVAWFVSLILGVSMALTACSGGNTVNVELSDSALTPNTISVPAGKQVTFSVKNTGTAEYDCAFRDLSTLKSLPSQFYWGINQIAAGATKSGTFSAPSQPASFQIACGPSPFDPVTSGTAKAILATLVVK